MGSTEAYPTYAEIREGRLAKRRAEARHVLLRMEEYVRSRGGRLLVFGSLAEGGFGERSDVDVAVMGIPPDLGERVAVRIEEALEAAGFECDVLTERALRPPLKQRILARGVEPCALG